MEQSSEVSGSAMIGELVLELVGAPSLDDLLTRAVEVAATVVPGCEQAGVSVQADGEIRTAASTGPLAATCDQLEAELSAGPCVTALHDQDLVVVDDMAAEDRWPEFALRAARSGVASMLACRLPGPARRLAALNLYSTVPGSFTAEAQMVAVAYSGTVGVAVAALDREANLRVALQSRETIGQAVGILVERYRITATQAFDLMVQASQNTNIKLRDIAEELTTSGVLHVRTRIAD